MIKDEKNSQLAKDEKLEDRFCKTESIIQNFLNKIGNLKGETLNFEKLKRILLGVQRSRQSLADNSATNSLSNANYKKRLAASITDAINTLVAGADRKSGNRWNIGDSYATSGSLLSVLNSMGFDVFDIPVGSIFDFSLDVLSADIKNPEVIEPNVPMRVEKSEFGCRKVLRTGNNGGVVTKAKVTLSPVKQSGEMTNS